MYEWPFDLERARLSARARTEKISFSGIRLPEPLKQRLEARLGADLILPENSKYADERRVFNGAFDPFPAAIAICNSEDDVASCLQGARDYDVQFCIRGSGHSFAGFSSLDDSLVIDLRRLKDIQIDVSRSIVSVGAGCTLSDLDAALDSHSLRLPLGKQPLAVGGFMQGGGYSLLARTLGMNCDSVLEIRMMLTDGEIVTANEAKNHDLWWAVRGGTGGNFGVLLSVKYLAHPRDTLNSKQFSWNLSEPSGPAAAARAITTMQQILETAPKELSIQADIRYNPATTKPLLRISANFFGSVADLDKLLSPLELAIGRMQRPLIVALRPVSNPFVRESRFVSRLPLEGWRALIDDFLANSNQLSTLTIDAMDGAIGEFPLEKSAFIHRSAKFNVYVTGYWIKGDRQDEQKVAAYLKSWGRLIDPFWNGRVFQNFPYRNVPNYKLNYWGDAFAALFAVKRKYDRSGFCKFEQAVDQGVTSPPPPTWPPLVVDALNMPIEV